MDGEKIEGNVGGVTKNTVSASQNEAMKKCLEENKDDHTKCKSILEAYKSTSPSKDKRALPPLKLRSGALTDV